MKRSLSVVIMLSLIALLSGCIISYTPKEDPVQISQNHSITFTIKVFPSNAKFTWMVDGVEVAGVSGNSFSYAPGDIIKTKYIVSVKATHSLGEDSHQWNVYNGEAVKVIGPEGGTVEVTDAESRLFGTKVIIPENALLQNETISIAIQNNPPEVPLPDGFSVEGEYISFESSAEAFDGPVYVMIPYNGDRQEDETRVVFTYNEASSEWEPVVPLPTTDPNLFIGEVHHFSNYVKAKATISLTKIQSGFSMEDDTLAYDNDYDGICAGMALLASEYYNNWANKEGESLRCRWDKETSELASIDANRRWLGKDTSTTEKLGQLFNAFLLLINWSGSVIDGSYVVDYVKVMAGFNKVVPINMLGFSPPGHVVVATGWEKTGLLSGKINVYDVDYPDSDFMSIPYVILPPIVIKLNYGEYFVFLISNDWGLNIDESVSNYASQHLCLEDPIIDDFEDGIIDQNLWLVGGSKRDHGTSNWGNWSYSQQEIVSADGYLQLRVQGPESANTFGAESWVRTRYNFNDGKHHIINFRWKPDFNDWHYNRYYIEITNGYLSPKNDLHWIFTNIYPGNVHLLDKDSVPVGWGFENIPSPGILDWSIEIYPSGLACLYEGPNGTGISNCETLNKNIAWYNRFMISDGTSIGFPAGEAWLNLYDYRRYTY